MKSFLTEKHNIPEGATHYRDEDNSYRFAWYKVVDGIAFIWTPDGLEKWLTLLHQEEFGDDCVKEIPIPQTKEVEWDGEGLPPVGVECEMIFDGKGKLITPLYFTDFVDGMVLFYHSSNSMPHCDDTYDWCLVENCIFRKPETEEQRKEREELEAAYDLYCEFRSKNNLTVCSIDNLDREPGFEFVMFLVRKTGYRKRE